MFTGRYGNDKLNRTLLISALAIGVITIFLPAGSPARYVLIGASGMFIALCVFRAFSRNFYGRRKENEAYLNFEEKVKAFFSGESRRERKAREPKRKVVDINEVRRYKHLICPNCKQKLRVPRGKGKLKVTCSKCGTKFDAKS